VVGDFAASPDTSPCECDRVKMLDSDALEQVHFLEDDADS
jgi:hypothetical protein